MDFIMSEQLALDIPIEETDAQSPPEINLAASMLAAAGEDPSVR